MTTLISFFMDWKNLLRVGCLLGIGLIAFFFVWRYSGMEQEIAYEKETNIRLHQNYLQARQTQLNTEGQVKRLMEENAALVRVVKERETYIVNLHSKINVTKQHIKELENENASVRSLLTTVLPYELCSQIFTTGCTRGN